MICVISMQFVSQSDWAQSSLSTLKFWGKNTLLISIWTLRDEFLITQRGKEQTLHKERQNLVWGSAGEPCPDVTMAFRDFPWKPCTHEECHSNPQSAFGKGRGIWSLKLISALTKINFHINIIISLSHLFPPAQILGIYLEKGETPTHRNSGTFKGKNDHGKKENMFQCEKHRRG